MIIVYDFFAHQSENLWRELIGWAVDRHRCQRRQHFQTTSPLKLLANRNQITCGAAMGWETKVCSQCLGHMTKMLPCPYMVKTFENLLLRNRMTRDLEL